jgi:diguanylate cyclase (GGDEF)-like protein/PAS domain S-box-containing protein
VNARPLTRPAVTDRSARNRTDWPRLAARTLGVPAALLLSREADGARVERPHGDPSLLETLRAGMDRAMASAEPQASAGALAVPVRDAGGTVLGALGVAEPGRAWKQPELGLLMELAAGAAAEIAARDAMTALRDSEERFRAMFEGAAIGVLVVTMDGRIVQTNAAYREMVRLGEKELHGLEFWKLNHPDDSDGSLSLFRDMAAGRRGSYRMEKRYLLPSGNTIWVHLAAAAVRDGAGKPRFCVAMVENVTGRKAAEERLRHDALHDALTDLPNRTLFGTRLARAAARTGEDGAPRPFAVVFLDLERFKLVTDSLGHLKGDELLRIVAARLLACVGPADTVARFGGDEFVLLLDGVADAAEAARRAEQIQAALSAPVSLGGYEVFTSASIGVALSADGQGHPDELLRNADAAMYHARSLGAERFAVFTRSMHHESLRRLQLETDLRQAVRRGEFRLVYQPIVELATERTVGWEVLVRWHHPERGMVGPVEFIGVAEDTGLIVPLGRWVLREACRQLAAWEAEFPGDEPRFVCVNLSARQFGDARLLHEVEAAVGEHGLRAGSLKLELTESTVMRDPDQAIPLLRRFRALGIPIYLDDFGTGYSSLSLLHQLPLDGLKIDRSFVQRADGTAVVQTIVALARSLGVAIVAEGIEEPAQFAALRAMGCEYGQGYLFARPMDPEQVPACLHRTVPASAS